MILDIQTLAKSCVAKVGEEIKENGYDCRLVILLVGVNPASEVYVRNKQKRCQEVGIHTQLVRMDSTSSEEEVIDFISELNHTPHYHGILVQSPLPPHIDAQKAFDSINPDKDVDGFTSKNVYDLYHGKTDGLVPCTPKGVMRIIENYLQMKSEKGEMSSPVDGDNLKFEIGNLKGNDSQCENLKNGNIDGRLKIEDGRLSNYKKRGKKGENLIGGLYIVIIGKSPIVGKPLALMLMNAGATVTVCHSRTKNLKKHTKMADIVISAVGKKKLVTKDMIKSGALVIDVGINVEEIEGVRKLSGDCDTKNIAKIADITPVPGGVGPMTIAMLVTNVLVAYKNQVQ